MSRERNDDGQYIEQATIDAVLAVLEDTDERVMTAAEVAEEIGVSRETARRKLNTLYDQGRIQRKDVGARAVVWWTRDQDD